MSFFTDDDLHVIFMLSAELHERQDYIDEWNRRQSEKSEEDLINQAIESAQCRIYRLKQNEGSTLAHQVKAKNQQELMNITIKALEYYRDRNKK